MELVPPMAGLQFHFFYGQVNDLVVVESQLGQVNNVEPPCIASIRACHGLLAVVIHKPRIHHRDGSSPGVPSRLAKSMKLLEPDVANTRFFF